MSEGLRELVVVSGKGGTGKTSLAAAFAVLADRPVIADCDVDAADLHLVLAPRVLERREFRSGRGARILQEICADCGVCEESCRFGAIGRWGARMEAPQSAESAAATAMSAPAKVSDTLQVDPFACEGCGVCRLVCPAGAIELTERTCGSWMISETRCGPMVHARLGVGGENSGKLVSIVREEARRIGRESGRSTLIVDGPPGLGCPVIASITGASALLVVTEPTVSGSHDLMRVLALARHFAVPASVCTNRWDLNPEMTEKIETDVVLAGASVAGRIRYDLSVARAQILKKAVTEIESPAGDDIRRVWARLNG